MIQTDKVQLITSHCLLLVVFFKHSLYFTIYVGLHTMSSPSFTIVNRVNRGFSIMNPSDVSATSSSSKFFQGFDRFLKKQGGKGATTSSWSGSASRLCHGVGVHPDSYKLPELGDDSRSSGYNMIIHT